MPRFQHQAGAVLAYLRAFRSDVHVMPAAGYGDVASSGQSADDGADHVLDPIPPAGGCRLLGLFNVLFIDVHDLLFGSEMLEKRHGSKARDREFLVLSRGKNPASPLVINRLNSQ